jgi:succinylarginine dihydrolase
MPCNPNSGVYVGGYGALDNALVRYADFGYRPGSILLRKNPVICVLCRLGRRGVAHWVRHYCEKQMGVKFLRDLVSTLRRTTANTATAKVSKTTTLGRMYMPSMRNRG